ncbi:alpha-rhamnosidase [Sulfodiicoccus acidiphilus]|uniref:alpha-L-rhamnosidase n=1 Tax=Sulfodiicoccus acidiphilus TaxID=1670455 RepID=A0A348B545_9CREN|nr:alpha-L-rhamnosidase [Sulfodiicoccus acidiphilus]BBD73297.1 alpha-rhamnosidase [Sulfodiicoccus acidiphilus]GGT89289.1 alpha-rhamnosidase [Sulfodiicoccus acidiphilus]
MSVQAPVELRCEYVVNPVGVEGRPRLSWVVQCPERGVRQSAFRLIVSTSEEVSLKEVGDVWDSGEVNSELNEVRYDGPPLRSNSRYFWRIKWWDSRGRESPWSTVAYFHTGLLKEEDWKASWISGGKLLRREFDVLKPVRLAMVFVTGLGYYELKLNGEKVGDRVLDPAWTDYSKRVLYATYDVTSMLRRGKNVLGIMLGKGRYAKEYGYEDRRVAILQLEIEYTDGTRERVVTDSSWRSSDGPIVDDDLYNGEVYDARLEKPHWDSPGYDDRDWREVEVVKGPEGKLRSSTLPPIRRVRTIQPLKLLVPRPGVYVFDMGQNFSGWARLKVRGPRGTEVRLRFSELADERGNLDRRNLRKAMATDVYVLRGGGEEIYEPHFTYHGFRYVEVTGYPGVPTLDSVVGVVVHSDVEPTGSIATSNPLVNSIHRAVWWGQLSNLMGVPTDCPQRDERMGWTGDAQLSAEEASLNFWMVPFYEKWVEDILDAQAPDGMVPGVAPPHWRVPGDPAWGTAIVVVPWTLYLYYGDVTVLERAYDGMRKWVEFLFSKAESYVLRWGTWGDWCPPSHVHPVETPLEVTSTWILYRDSLVLSEVAGVLGRVEDQRKYGKLASMVKEAFNSAFLKGDHYSTGSQTCDVLPLYLDMVPEDKVEAVLNHLLRDVQVSHDNHLNTGILGTRYLLETLSKYGKSDVAYAIATQETYPSWGYMLREGATTVWERWEYLAGEGMNSHNHIMLGTVDAWFYRNLAGIRVLEPGFRKFRVRPDYVDLKFVEASVYTPRGRVEVSLKRGEGTEMRVVVPVGSEAEVNVPLTGISVKEGDVEIVRGGEVRTSTDGIKDIKVEDRYLKVEVASGTYQFQVY